MGTILIVEDEVIIRELIGETLSFEGYQVLQAGNGKQALEILGTVNPLPDLIICDIMMPEMNGHDLIAALQADPRTAAIPFIFLTALGTLHDFRKGMNSGADDYLVKPFQQEELLEAVTSRLRKKAQWSAFYQDQTPNSVDNVLLTLTEEEQALFPDLEAAIDQGQIYLCYQPQVAIASRCLAGCEALVRWNHPERGVISPGVFIPLAEKTQLITRLGERVMHLAMAQCLAWRNQGLPAVRVGINISAQQFHGKILLEQLKAAMATYDISPQHIEVELTETLLVNNIEESMAQLQTLRGQGFKVAIDDFGTGYSSLSYLQQFPFDVLKIDQSFVRGIDQNDKNTTITASIINLAHELGLTVIAEGVETWAEFDTIARLGCDELQGYLFSRPLAVEAFTPLLAQGLHTPLQPPR